jgi:hypothetical protein
MIVRERWLEMKGIRGSMAGTKKENRPYFCGCTQLVEEKIISSLASSLFSPCDFDFQGRHIGRGIGPSPTALNRHGNVH